MRAAATAAAVVKRQAPMQGQRQPSPQEGCEAVAGSKPDDIGAEEEVEEEEKEERRKKKRGKKKKTM